MQTSSISLTKISSRDDIHFLYKSMTSSDQYLYSTKIRYNSEHSFEQWILNQLNGNFHDFYLVEDKKCGRIGFVHNYDFSLLNGHCKLVVYISPTFREFGVGGIAAIMFMKKLFKDYPLRKLYTTVYDYNNESLQSNLRAGFQEEGVLKHYRYYSGHYYDIHYLSMTREKFESTIGKLV